ncbi:CocE/NonD family hydrolase [Steroidobacter flavus]|uniref:CocE/NonD family hydrolase n=1 Tax=Steroidobacter flavus TaxID=1842136 RepID=A0ABV8SZ92_9GAMM
MADGFRHWAAMLLASVVVSAASPAIASNQAPVVTVSAPSTGEVDRRRSTFVPMRDGVRLSTDIYSPRSASGPLPTILIRTPYNKDREEARAIAFARYGFTVVVQDHRGRFESEGRFFPYSRIDGQDGYDTVDWIAHQPWSTGKVGTFGCSYLGETQHMLARERHPNHRAAIAQAGSSYGGDGVRNFGFQRYGATELSSGASWMYRNGSSVFYGPPAGIDRAEWFSKRFARRYSVAPSVPADDLRLAMFERLPVVDLLDSIEAPPNEWRQWVSKPPADDYWQQQGTVTEADRFDVPTLHMNGWYDLTPNSTLALFRLFRDNAESRRAADNQFLIMYPGTHCVFDYPDAAVVGERPVGNPTLDPMPIYVAWFNHWLRDERNDITRRLPHVLSYALGINQWRNYPSWPPVQAKSEKWYLASDGDARSRFGSGRLSVTGGKGDGADSYIYDPTTPVPTLGGSICCAGPDVKSGAVDQRAVESRSDVLVFSSEALKSPLEVAGPVRAFIRVSADVPDTDLVVRLTDVYPEGTSYNITEGILRLRYRDGLTQEKFLRAGEAYDVSVDMESTHNVFLPGHRIRVHVTSSSFPRWDRNLNTGGRNFDETRGRIAGVTVHHGSGTYLLLPVIK